jgi:hypothetical protein
MVGLAVFGLMAVLAGGEFGIAAGIVLLALGIGHWITLERSPWQCSEPNCRALVHEDAGVCPECGGIIEGVLHNAEDQIEAREALLRKNAERSPARSDE